MKNSEQSTNSQRTSELQVFKELIITALIFIVVLLVFVFIFNAVNQNIKNLEARCKSLGGVTGQTKCFKDGKEL
jgi:hypothetical protein